MTMTVRRWTAAALVLVVLAVGGWLWWWKATADDRQLDAIRKARYTLCMGQADRADDYAGAVAACLERYGDR